MHLFKQKLNGAAILGQTGLILHVPAAMAAITMLIALVFGEWFALIPFGTIAVVTCALGQIAYRLGKKARAAHLWDAMLIAGLSWILCSFFAAIPLYWIAQTTAPSNTLAVFAVPTNALFEAFSGFTSTGLTMMQGEDALPFVLQWWRSFLEWIGGLGLVVFILALTHLNKQGFQLYYAEARSEKMMASMTKTAHWIFGIYLAYTAVGCLLFFALGMPLWEAINHAMTVISNGGFTIGTSSFQDYSLPIQIVALFMMVIGAMSFAIHFRVIREKEFFILWKSLQHRLLYFFLIGGGVLLFLLHLWNQESSSWSASLFEWTSALTTCGFSAAPLSSFSPMVKLLLIMAMFVGGTTGSTSGGLKIKRLIYLTNGIFLRLQSITTSKEKKIMKKTQAITDEPPGIALPKTAKSERLVTAEVLFSLWAATLFLAWFLLLHYIPSGKALDALFEVTSAMSNVGLSTGIVSPTLATFPKWLFIALMWLGRLEIIPALVLLFTFPLMITRKKRYGKKS